VRKITNKKKSSKKRFKELFKGIPIPTYSWQKIDDDLILIDYNDAAEKITKGMIKNYVGIKASEMYKDQPEILEELFRCANDHVSIFREMKYDYMSTGEDKFLSVMYGFIPPDLVIIHTEDITAKKEVLERLKKSEKELKALTLELKQRIDISEEKYKTIFENTGTATIIVEEDTTISLVNEQFEELFGYSREEIEWKKSWTELVVEEDLERMEKLHYFRRKDPESTLRKYEFRATDKKGDIRDIFIVLDLIPGTKQSVASLLDITARKKTEEKLKDSEEKYRYLFDNAQVGLYWSRISDGKFLECNETFAKLFGYDTREEFLANYNAVEHYINPNARSDLIEEIHDNKEAKNYEINVTKKDGTPIWLSISARISEKESRFEGAAIEITERKQAERELQFERDNFLNILNSMEDGVYIVDKNYDIEYINPSLIKEFGQLEGKKCFKYFEDRNEVCLRCNNNKVFQGKTVRGEWFSFKNQKTYDLIDTPLKNPDGSISKLAIFRDISESKKAEQVLKESEEKFRDLFESSPISLWEEDFSELKNYVETLKNSGIKDFRVYFDKNPEEVIKCISMIKIVDINKKTLELYKANKKEVFFAGLDKVFTEESLDTFKELIISFAGGKTRFESEAINRTLSSDKLNIFIVCEIVAGFKEDWSKVLVSIIDISELKKAEQELKESEEKYREAYNRAEFYKDLFAHDINNILQSILSGIQISQLVIDHPEKRDSLKINAGIIKEQVIRGAKLVSNVQKLSKLEEAGQNLEKIEILNVLKNTISHMKKSYKDKNLATRVDSIGEKLFIKANSLLEDVFENLLINAVRHNKNLTIEITFRISRERKVGISYLKIEILDNGIGVADSMKEKIFQRGNIKEKGVYGMGLGLALVRGII
jgi:PAS domain S-box-containing protein